MKISSSFINNKNYFVQQKTLLFAKFAKKENNFKPKINI